ncbi:MAG: MBG domain-containing protein [Clostridia bacterium]|nr:MBG domain-containing protein [Clostridia bacterium]
MKRKIFAKLNLILIILSVFSLMLVFVSCNSEEDFHLHHYEKSVTEPTCQQGGYTTYICSCGHSYQDNFTAKVAHHFENGECVYCGLEQLTITYRNTKSQKNPNPVNFTKDDSFELKDLPDTDGWAFNGWTDSRGRKITEISLGTTESLILTAQWRTDVPLDKVKFVNETYVYDGTVKTLIADNIPELCTVSYENNSGINAGTYKAKARFLLDGASCGTKNAILTIEKAPYIFENLVFEDDTFTYDGFEKSIEVKNLPQGATVTYINNGKRDAGVYTVKAIVRYDDGNYEGEETLEAVLTIEKAVYDMSGVLFENESVVFDGKAKSLEVKNLPSGIMPLYSGKDFINAGTYPVEVSFLVDSCNYYPVSPMNAVLTILKADYDLSGITYSVSPSPFYNGQPHSLEVAGLPDGVRVIFDRDDCINAGKYTLLATFISDNTNYNDIPDVEIEMTILKADYDLSGIVYSESTFTYDGTPHSVSVSSLPDGVTASYSSTDMINAGEYSVEITFYGDSMNHNSIAPVTKLLTILRADADISSVKFESEVCTYDGSPKFIYALGVPPYISVSYENNGKIASGEYTVTAHFTVDETNYYPVDDMTAVLTIEYAEYAAEQIKFESASFKYDGQPKSLYVVNLPEDVMVSYSTANLTEIGEYEITASFTADPMKYGTIADKKATLIIEKGDIDMSGVIFSDMSVRYDGGKKNIVIRNVPEGVSVFFDKTDLKEVGSYLITASFTADTSKYNEILPMSATLVILKGIYDISSAVFENTSAVYDGNKHTVSVSGLPEGVSYSAGASYADAGIYDIEVSFEGDSLNYEPIQSKKVQLTIQKAKLDMSGVVFSDLTAVYDGNIHRIVAENLPAGVTALYSNNEAKDAGEYRAVVSFVHSQNYIQVSPKKAVLTILKKEISVEIIGKTRVVYNKKPHKDYSAEFTGVVAGDELNEKFIYSGDMTGIGSYSVRVKINNSNYQLNGSASLAVTIYNEEYFVHAFPNTSVILYKVGNANDISISSLFRLLDGKELDSSLVMVEVRTLSGNVSASFTKGTEWNLGALRFRGTGVASVKISEDGGGELELCVEVVNAKNATKKEELSGSVVFLNDIKTANSSESGVSFSNASVYGNGFTFDVRNVNNKIKGAVNLINSQVFNLKITGEVYQQTSFMVNTPYYCSTVVTYGKCLIQGCYISNCRYCLVAEEGVLDLADTVLDGGRQGNMNITYAKVNAHNLMTINQPRENVCGLGIVFDNNATEKASLSISGSFIQYNWIAKNRDIYIFEDPQLKSVFDEVFRPKYAQFQFMYDGDIYINMGIVSLNPGVGPDAVTGVPSSYLSMNALLMGYHGFVMTCLNTEYVFTSPSMLPPDFNEENVPVRPVYTYSGPSLNAGGNIEIICNEGELYDFNMNFLKAEKNGTRLSIIPTVSGKEYSSGIISINTESSNTFEIVYKVQDTEVYNPDGTKVSVPYIWEIKYSVEVRVVKDLPEPVFSFTDKDGKTYSSQIITVDGVNYIAPVGGETATGIPVPFVTVEGFRERTADRTIYHYFPCFAGVSVWDYTDDARKIVVGNSSSQSLPEGITLVESNGFTGTTTGVLSRLVIIMKDGLLAVRGSGNASYEEVAAANSVECTVYMKFRYEANNGHIYYYYIAFHMAEGPQ